MTFIVQEIKTDSREPRTIEYSVVDAIGDCPPEIVPPSNQAPIITLLGNSTESVPVVNLMLLSFITDIAQISSTDYTLSYYDFNNEAATITAFQDVISQLKGQLYDRHLFVITDIGATYAQDLASGNAYNTIADITAVTNSAQVLLKVYNQSDTNRYGTAVTVHTPVTHFTATSNNYTVPTQILNTIYASVFELGKAVATSYDANSFIQVSATEPRVLNITSSTGTVLVADAITINEVTPVTYNDLGATATDTEDGGITANITTVITNGANVVIPSVDGTAPDTYTITYSVSDSGSPALSATATRTVTVGSAL